MRELFVEGILRELHRYGGRSWETGECAPETIKHISSELTDTAVCNAHINQGSSLRHRTDPTHPGKELSSRARRITNRALPVKTIGARLVANQSGGHRVFEEVDLVQST